MKHKHEVPATDRRSFLKGVAAASGTALTTLFVSNLLAGETQGTALPKSEVKASRGYHETDHIRDYYRTLKT
jgi:hypothetical protein